MGLPNFSTSADTNSKIHHQDLGDATLPQGERKSSPGLIDVCKGLWREISWRLAGERIAEAAIERFAERLGKTSERIEELQVSLGRAGFLEKEKQAYTNPRHSVAVQLLEGPIAQYLGAVSGQADSILSATEREIINLLRFDDKIGNGAKGLKCDIITALRDANLNRRQKEFLVELDAKTLSGAEKSVGSLERSLTNGLRQFEAEIGNLCAEDRNFFNGSSLFVTQSDALITQGELDQVRTAYTKRRNDIFVTLSDELEKVVSAGDLTKVEATVQQARNNLANLQQKAQATYSLLEQSGVEQKKTEELAGIYQIASSAPIELKTDKIVTKFSSDISEQIRKVWRGRVQSAQETCTTAREAALGCEESALKALTQAVDALKSSRAQAEELVAAITKTLKPFVSFAADDATKTEPALLKKISSLTDVKLKRSLEDLYLDFNLSAETAVKAVLQFNSKSLKAVSSEVEQVGWRKRLLSSAVEASFVAPHAATAITSAAVGLRSKLELLENHLADHSPKVWEAIDRVSNNFYKMTLAEASRTTDPFKDPEEFKKQVALSVDQDKEAKKLAMIARVVSRVPEAEKSAIAEELFENVFPSQNS